MIKIRIVIPHYQSINNGGISTLTLDNIGRIISDGKYKVDFVPTQQTYIYRSRNYGINYDKSAAIYQQITDCDYVIQWDADISIQGNPIEYIDKMISSKKHVISGAYPYKRENENHQIVAGYWYANMYGVIKDKIATNTKGIFKIDWCGAGWLLIKSNVFGNIKYPWFHHFLVEHDGNRIQCGEDMGFCKECAKSGIPIYINCNEKLNHISIT